MKPRPCFAYQCLDNVKMYMWVGGGSCGGGGGSCEEAWAAVKPFDKALSLFCIAVARQC